MLVLTRTRNTTVRIGADISVTVREFVPAGVGVEIDYPPAMALRGPAGPIQGRPAPDATAPHGSPAGAPFAVSGAAELPAFAAALATAAPDRLRASFPLCQEDEFWLGDQIMVKVVALMGAGDVPSRVRLGFQAPKDLRIERSDYKGDARPPIAQPPIAPAAQA